MGSLNDHFCKCSVLYLRWHSRWLGQKLPKIRWRNIWMVPKGIHRGVKALSDGPSRLALGIPWKQFNYSCYSQNLPWKLRQQRDICWNSLAQTFSVRTFWPARTSHKVRNVRRTPLHAIFCARMRTRKRTFFQKKISKKKFFLVFFH